MDGWMPGQVDEWMTRWINGQTDGWLNAYFD